MFTSGINELKIKMRRQTESGLNKCRTQVQQREVNVILGLFEGVIDEIEVFDSSAYGRKSASQYFNKLCKLLDVSRRHPFNDEHEVRWFVTKFVQ